MRSSAQVSEASTQASPRLPEGQRPEAGGSRTAIMLSGSAAGGCRRPCTRVSARASWSTSVAALGPREEVQDHLGVGRRLEDRAVLLELLPQRLRVDEVAVVGDGHRPVRGGLGLRFLGGNRTGRLQNYRGICQVDTHSGQASGYRVHQDVNCCLLAKQPAISDLSLFYPSLYKPC